MAKTPDNAPFGLIPLQIFTHHPLERIWWIFPLSLSPSHPSRNRSQWFPEEFPRIQYSPPPLPPPPSLRPFLPFSRHSFLFFLNPVHALKTPNVYKLITFPSLPPPPLSNPLGHSVFLVIKQKMTLFI